jgi:hypothetical chaperone protein
VLGRPVFFVDDDPVRDAAGAGGAGAGRAAGGLCELLSSTSRSPPRWTTSAALTRTAGAGGRHRRRHLRLLAGARGPERRGPADRRDDILANHGVHVAGTDFDRHLELAAILPLFGYRASGPRRGEPADTPQPRCPAASTSTSPPGT